MRFQNFYLFLLLLLLLGKNKFRQTESVKKEKREIYMRRQTSYKGVDPRTFYTAATVNPFIVITTKVYNIQFETCNADLYLFLVQNSLLLFIL